MPCDGRASASLKPLSQTSRDGDTQHRSQCDCGSTSRRASHTTHQVQQCVGDEDEQQPEGGLVRRPQHGGVAVVAAGQPLLDELQRERPPQDHARLGCRGFGGAELRIQSSGL